MASLFMVAALLLLTAFDFVGDGVLGVPQIRKNKKISKNFKKSLTSGNVCDIIIKSVKLV